MTDIVVASLEAWDAVWRRNQHLVSRLLRSDPHLRVLFVEPPADPMHALRRRTAPRRGAGLRPAPPLPGIESGRLMLFQPTKMLPRRVDPLVDRRLADQVMHAARECGMSDPVLWVNDPGAAAVLEQSGWRTLYDITDDWLHAGHSAAEHERLTRHESLLLDRAAQVVVCSPALLASKGTDRGPASISLVPNAVDPVGYVDPGPRPDDLPAGPVALYVGTVHRDRVDVELCASTAQSLAGRATVVLLGPTLVDETDRELLQASGVRLLGPRDHSEVPRYLTHADVLLVPHVVTAFTESLDPIKLYEYRAASRPVVSTPVAGFRDAVDPLLTVASAAGFPRAVRDALDRPDDAVRPIRDVPTWDERAVAMGRVIDQVVTSRPARGYPTVAIAHDYLTQRGGAERVVLAMHRAFPAATIYTTLYNPETTYPEFRDAHIVTSALNRLGPLRRHHRAALPLLPLVSRSLRIDEDVVVSSSSGWAHGFAASGRRLVYCHAPARWLYQTEAYLGVGRERSLGGWALVVLAPWLRRWDHRHALAADRYLANSRVVRDRVRDAYGVEATVVPAPHAMDADAFQAPLPEVAAWTGENGYYLVVSRLLPYKNVDAVVEAFRDLDERLVIVGDGPLRRTLERTLPDNVLLVSNLTDPQLHWMYAHCRALVAPSLEDYGLTPLEAAAYGKPTLALGAGGYLDTVVPGVTGSFFDAPTPAAIRAAVLDQRDRVWSAAEIADHADRFSEPVFHAALHAAVAELASAPPPRAPETAVTPGRSSTPRRA
ncbi:MAG: glycosyltransferase [Lapillicoccus sp.]